MRVRVSYFGFLKLKLQRDFEEAQLSKGASVRDLLLYLADRRGENFRAYVFDPVKARVKEDILVALNSLPIRQIKGLDTELNNGDRVDVLPLFLAGG